MFGDLHMKDGISLFSQMPNLQPTRSFFFLGAAILLHGP